MKKFKNREEYQAWKDEIKNKGTMQEQTCSKKSKMNFNIFKFSLLCIALAVAFIVRTEHNNKLSEQNDIKRKNEAYEVELRLKNEKEDKIMAEKERKEAELSEQIRKNIEIEKNQEIKQKKLNLLKEVESILSLATMQCIDICSKFHTKLIVEEVTTGYYSAARQRLVYMKDGTVEEMDKVKDATEKSLKMAMSIKEEEYSDIYNELLNMYEAYAKCYDLSSGPTGTLSSYKIAVDDNYERYKASSAKLGILLPSR